MTINSDIKTALLALIGAAAFIAAALVSVAPAHSEPMMRITAIGVSETPGPSKYNEWRARRLAIRHWQEKVAIRHGSAFARWQSARGAEMQCDGRARFVRCEARAYPGLRRW